MYLERLPDGTLATTPIYIGAAPAPDCVHDWYACTKTTPCPEPSGVMCIERCKLCSATRRRITPDPLAEDEYECALCHGVFKKGDPKEVMAEAVKNFGAYMEKETDIASVCDDCYEKIHPAKHPHLAEQAAARALEGK